MNIKIKYTLSTALKSRDHPFIYALNSLIIWPQQPDSCWVHMRKWCRVLVLLQVVLAAVVQETLPKGGVEVATSRFVYKVRDDKHFLVALL